MYFVLECNIEQKIKYKKWTVRVTRKNKNFSVILYEENNSNEMFLIQLLLIVGKEGKLLCSEYRYIW